MSPAGSGLNAPLTIASQISGLKALLPDAAGGPRLKTPQGCDMDFETKTPATIEEIRARVAYALERHPLCRNVQFDIVSMPPTIRGGNWTISLQSVASDALWVASDIVADIQEAYDLCVAA